MKKIINKLVFNKNSRIKKIYSLLNKDDFNILKNYKIIEDIYLDMNVYLVNKYTFSIFKYGKIKFCVFPSIRSIPEGNCSISEQLRRS